LLLPARLPSYLLSGRPALSRLAALSNQESLKEAKLGALHQALAMYRQRLGLEFVHGEGDGERLRVVMTLLDPRDHARPFQFAVQVAADNTYAGVQGRGRAGQSGNHSRREWHGAASGEVWWSGVAVWRLRPAACECVQLTLMQAGEWRCSGGMRGLGLQEGC